MKVKFSASIAKPENIKKYYDNPATKTRAILIILLLVSFICYVLASFFAYVDSSAPKTATEAIIGGVTDSNAANSFQKINMELRVMPSHKTEGNKIRMIANSGTAEWQHEYDDDFADSISDDYFTTDKMQDYFPEFSFNENTVPLGNAKPFCLHLDWSTKNVRNKGFSVQD